MGLSKSNSSPADAKSICNQFVIAVYMPAVIWPMTDVCPALQSMLPSIDHRNGIQLQQN